ncbi:Uncharacterised protein [Chlamydia trachomatis]|nr:Uncharacterised protein [Chlamydia trachomatis]CRH90568.1 Uncharacterised protein [Chlamydia trachomatis]DAI80681.1 MAG TPA: hypothetical protein [Caudoviricetes sp.]
MKIHNMIIGASVSLALGLAGTGTGAAAASENEGNGRGVSIPAVSTSVNLNSISPSLSDAELDRLIQVLDRVPENLRNANPRTTPNYEAELSRALNGIRVGGIATRASWWQCGAEIASVIVQYGLPVGKVLKWLKEARKIWGGVSGIWRAIKSGAAFAEIGEEGVQALEIILGFDGVISACFG